MDTEGAGVRSEGWIQGVLGSDMSYVRSSDRSGVFGDLLGVPCACAHLRNEDFGGPAVSEKTEII